MYLTTIALPSHFPFLFPSRSLILHTKRNVIIIMCEAKEWENKNSPVLSTYLDFGRLGNMKNSTPIYQRHRFPAEIINHAVWLYHRFCLSFREVDEFLVKRGITVT